VVMLAEVEAVILAEAVMEAQTQQIAQI